MTAKSFDRERADQLVTDLLLDPEAFERSSRAAQLLDQFFMGYSPDKLRPLLRHEDNKVVRSAIWIASELGETGTQFLDCAITLLERNDSKIRFFALDVIMVATARHRSEEFYRITQSLEDKTAGVRNAAIRHMDRASNGQITAALEHFKKSYQPVHNSGLQKLLNPQSNEPAEVEAMIDAPDALWRKYGALVAARLYNKVPRLLMLAAQGNDESVRRFAQYKLGLLAVDKLKH